MFALYSLRKLDLKLTRCFVFPCACTAINFALQSVKLFCVFYDLVKQLKVDVKK